MKVYFDGDGKLRHHECNKSVTADVSIIYDSCSVNNTDDDWDFGEFEALRGLMGEERRVVKRDAGRKSKASKAVKAKQADDVGQTNLFGGDE